MQVKCEIAIEETDENVKKLDAIEVYFLNEQKPMRFNPYEKDNVLMSGENSFEDVCATMQENGITDPKNLTEYEFYSRLKYLQEKYKKQSHGASK